MARPSTTLYWVTGTQSSEWRFLDGLVFIAVSGSEKAGVIHTGDDGPIRGTLM